MTLDGTRARRRPVALVVDDEDDIRLLLVEILTRHGYLCLEAADAHEALGVVDDLDIVDRKLDLAVLDIMLPGMAGDELGARLRRTCGDPAIVAVTARTDERLGEHLAARGFDATEHKPLDIRRFVRTCNAAVRLRRCG